MIITGIGPGPKVKENKVKFCGERVMRLLVLSPATTSFCCLPVNTVYIHVPILYRTLQKSLELVE